MTIIIDRFEGEYAVLEVDGEYVDFPKRALPTGAKEGDLLEISVSSAQDRLDEAQKRLERLKARDPGGEVFDL